MDDEKDYHIERARAELDLAYRADARPAAEAHLRLSSLHMERVRQADSSTGAAASRLATASDG